MLTQDEKDALKELKENGYSFTESMALIGGQRLNAPSTLKDKLVNEKKVPTPVLPTSLKETGSDVVDVFKKAGERTYEAGSKIVDKAKQGKPLGAISEFMGGIGKTLGGFFTDTAKIGISQEAEDTVTSFGQNIGQKIGESETVQNLKSAYDALPKDVQEQIGDAGRFAEGLAAIFGGSATTSALKSSLSAGKPVVTGLMNVTKDVSNDLAKIGKAGTEGISASKKLGLAPEDLMQRVARVSKGKQAKFEETAGESIGSFLVKRNIFGTPDQIAEQLYSRMKTSMGKVDTGLGKIKGEFKEASLADALDELIEREVSVSTSRTPSKDLFRVTQLQRKLNKQGLTLSEANEVKRLFEKNVKLDYLKDNVSGKIEQANQIDSRIREFVANTAEKNGFKDVAELNKETRLSRQLLDDVGAEYAGQQGNNLMSLSDAFFLAEAASNPSALLAFGLKKTLSSKGAMSAVAKLLSRNTDTYKMPEGVVDENVITPSKLGKPTSGQIPVRGDGRTRSIPIGE